MADPRFENVPGGALSISLIAINAKTMASNPRIKPKTTSPTSPRTSAAVALPFDLDGPAAREPATGPLKYGVPHSGQNVFSVSERTEHCGHTFWLTGGESSRPGRSFQTVA